MTRWSHERRSHMPSSFGVRLKSSLPSPSILPSLSFSLSLSLFFSRSLAAFRAASCGTCVRAFTTLDAFCDPDRGDRYLELAGYASVVAENRLTWFLLPERPPRLLHSSPLLRSFPNFDSFRPDELSALFARHSNHRGQRGSRR